MQQTFQLKISDNLGNVSAEIVQGEKVKAVITFAHGAGAGMNHPFMIALAEALAGLGIATLRCNFLYMEHNKKRPDVPAIAHKVIEAAVYEAHRLFPEVPLYLSGKSFGGRMSSQYLADNPIAFVKGIVFFGFPLHPAGKPSIERAEHLRVIKVPSFFIQGTRDDLAQWDLLEGVLNQLTQATLYRLEGADHSFKSGKLNLIPVLAQATAEWIGKVK